MDRRRAVSVSLAVACCLFALPTSSAAPVDPISTTDSIEVRLETVGTLPSSAGAPLYGTHVSDDRLFIAGQSGEVWFMQNGSFTNNEFFDTSDVVGTLPLDTGGERGLLGFAFHPNFNNPGQFGEGLFYTYTSEDIDGNAAHFFHPDELTSTTGHHQSVIREWQVEPGNPNRIDHSGSRVLMRIQQPQGNHNGGALAFGADNLLYVSLGDGGGSNDQSGGVSNNGDGHTDPPQPNPLGIPHGNSQDLRTILGSIARINPNPNDTSDPNATLGTSGEYLIPSDNPFFGQSNVVEEIFAYGLRNPFRMSFDGDDLWIGDVGQGSREEVNRLDVTSANLSTENNFAWVINEGSEPTSFGYSGMNLVDPVGEYSRAAGEGTAVIGGFVYRGSDAPILEGLYVFGDFSLPGNNTPGRLLYMETDTGEIAEFSLAPGSSIANNQNIHGFAEDSDGELYVLFSDREVVRIVPEPSTATLGIVALVVLGLAAWRWRRGSAASQICGSGRQ